MRIAAVGDSVMWGQGLMSPLNTDHFEGQEKFFFKVVEWLQNKGKVKDFDVADFQAHSGAIIGTSNQKSQKTILSREEEIDKEAFDRFYGEIPDDFPTVLKQLDNLKNGNTIDLLLINGGPNDVGIMKSADSVSDFNEGLRLIDEIASNKLIVLLREARKKCPNAIIIYTGYYPALSNESNPFDEFSPADPTSFASLAPVLNHLTLKEKLLGPIYYRFNAERILNQGKIFHQRILSKFREQIANFNNDRGSSTLPIIFCPSGIGSSNAMFTANQMISTLKDEDKRVSAFRAPYCQSIHQKQKLIQLFTYYEYQVNIQKQFKEYIKERYGTEYDQVKLNEQIKEFSMLSCENAYVAHPNKKGAEQYFKELKKRIDVQLNFKLREHIEGMDEKVSSLRELKEKYPFVPLKSLRGLSDVLWVDVITIKVDNDHYAGPSRPYLFFSTLYFDFGWGYHEVNEENGEFVLDVMGAKRLSSLKYVKIRLPGYHEPITKLGRSFFIKINGYSLPIISFTEESLQKSGDIWYWKLPGLKQ